MSNWELRDPWFLATVLLAPLVYYLLALRSRPTVTYSTLRLLDQSPRSLRVRLANLPALMTALSVLAMAIALTRPQTGNSETRVRREGIAIVMVVDRSGSMNARDLVKHDPNINRLDVVKSLFRQFVLGDQAEDTITKSAGRGRPDDVIGLVAFARFADGLCPLTLDHGNLVNIVNDLEIVTQRSEDGTAVGQAIALAVERLRKHHARSKVAIVLTDGVNNAGDISPDQAAELAAAHDIKVYCIGTGTKGRAPVPVGNDPFSGRTIFQSFPVEIDEKTLKTIALKTGGHYYRATDAQSLAEIYQQIDRLEQTEITEVRYLQYQEWYPAFVVAALAMIGGGGLLSGSFFRRLP